MSAGYQPTGAGFCLTDTSTWWLNRAHPVREKVLSAFSWFSGWFSEFKRLKVKAFSGDQFG